MENSFFANFSMNARIASILLLIIILGIPSGIYWYFFRSNTASIQVGVTNSDIFQVKLEWTLDNKYLPLADTFLEFQKECSRECIFSPIAPLHYTLTLSSSGKVTLIDEIEVGIWEDKLVNYTFQEDIEFIQYQDWLIRDAANANSVIENASKMDTNHTYKLVWIDKNNNIFAERSSTFIRELGIVTLDKFTSLYIIPEGVWDISLDLTLQYFVAPLYTDKMLVLSLDTSIQKELPLNNILAYAEWDQDKILTLSGVLTSQNWSYIRNSRFTDWIDISPSLRLWYISQEDTSKLELSNFPIWESVLLLLDRSSGKSHIIQKWMDIEFFYFIDGVPSFIDWDGTRWKIIF